MRISDLHAISRRLQRISRELHAISRDLFCRTFKHDSILRERDSNSCGLLLIIRWLRLNSRELLSDFTQIATKFTRVVSDFTRLAAKFTRVAWDFTQTPCSYTQLSRESTTLRLSVSCGGGWIWCLLSADIRLTWCQTIWCSSCFPMPCPPNPFWGHRAVCCATWLLCLMARVHHLRLLIVHGIMCIFTFSKQMYFNHQDCKQILFCTLTFIRSLQLEEFTFYIIHPVFSSESVACHT